jgi:nucleoside-diphosphate-sugar epimerase
MKSHQRRRLAFMAQPSKVSNSWPSTIAGGTGWPSAALRPQSIVYEGAYEWRLREYTGEDAAGVNKLWSFVDARDVATACLAWIQSERTGFQAFNVAADNVCVRTPTRDLLRKFYPHITDLRQELNGQTGLVSCAKIKRMLGWQPKYDWPAMEAESEAGHYARRPPPR